MKNILFIMLVFNCSALFGQENPYEMFGHKSKVEYRIGLHDLYKVKNTDTNSAIKFIAFDFAKGNIFYVGDNDSVLQTIGLKPEQLVRFIGVDPIADDFPHVTPYNYAENRPIDGIDLWGLQNVRYDVTLIPNSYAKPLIQMTDYRQTEQGYGPKGPGIEYRYNMNETHFIKNLYGIYAGGDNPMYAYKKIYDKQQFGQMTVHSLSKQYDYELNPIDLTDQGAYYHDQEYDAVNAVGLASLESDPYTIEADINAVNTWRNVLTLAENGQNDPVRGKPISTSQKMFTKAAILTFGLYIEQKKFIAAKEYYAGQFTTMKNFEDAVKKAGGYDAVYKLWRDQNMIQNENGVWIKK